MQSTKRHLDDSDSEPSDAKRPLLNPRKAFFLEQVQPHLLIKIAQKLNVKSLCRFHQLNKALHGFIMENYKSIRIPLLVLVDEQTSVVTRPQVGSFNHVFTTHNGLHLLGEKSGFQVVDVRMTPFVDNESPTQLEDSKKNILENFKDFPNNELKFLAWEDENRPSCKDIPAGSPEAIEFLERIPKIKCLEGALFETGLLNWYNQFDTDDERQRAIVSGNRCWNLITRYQKVKLWWRAEEGIDTFRMLLLEWTKGLDMGRTEYVSLALSNEFDLTSDLLEIFNGIEASRNGKGMMKRHLKSTEFYWMKRTDGGKCRCRLHKPWMNPPPVTFYTIRNVNMETATVVTADDFCSNWYAFVPNSDNLRRWFWLARDVNLATRRLPNDSDTDDFEESDDNGMESDSSAEAEAGEPEENGSGEEPDNSDESEDSNMEKERSEEPGSEETEDNDADGEPDEDA